MPGIARQMQQQIEFLGRKVNCLPLHGDGVGRGIHNKIAGLDGRSGPLRRPAQMRPHPRHQFLDAERLGHVIVRAGIERFHLRSLVVTHASTSTGVDPFDRIARQTSTPLKPGIIRSVITKSGVHSRKTSNPSSGSFAVRTSNACAKARRATPG